MSKNTIKLTAAFLVLIALILVGTISSAIPAANNAPASVVDGEKESNSEIVMTGGTSTDRANLDDSSPTEGKVMIDAEQLDYESVYLKYVKENIDAFSQGMILCDLNDDGIPELFSRTYDDFICYHEFKDGAVVPPSANTVKTYVSFDSLIHQMTFFENPDNFIGIYKNKTTGKKALINSAAEGSENDRFDIISFDGERLVLSDEGVKTMVDNEWHITEKRDTIMRDYDLTQDMLYMSIPLHGELGNNAPEILGNLIDDFKKSKSDVKYDKASDGSFYCYVRNINMTDNEIELIPAANITYEEYTSAMNSNKLITLNGESFSINNDPFLYDEYGIGTLYETSFSEYEFHVPTEEYPSSVIERYMGNTPVKIKISNNSRVRYGAIDMYNDNGDPIGYETMGRDSNYSISEYASHFAQYDNRGYYRAVVKNGELVFLDALYRE